MVDAYRFVRNPQWERAIRHDLAETRRDSTSLREMPPPASDAPVALLALYRDNIYDTKTALLLGTALRRRGLAAVVVMPNARGHRTCRYAAAFGVDRVLATDRVRVTSAERRECDTAVEAMQGNVDDFDALKSWTFRGYQAGMHLLSTLIRRAFDGSPDLAPAGNRDRLTSIAHDVARNYVVAERLVHELRPRCVLVEEANYSANGPLVDVATDAGIDVIQTITIWRDDAFLSKRLTAATRRVDAKSVARATFERLACVPLTPTENAELDDDFDNRYGGTWQLSRQFQPDTEACGADDIVAELGLDPDLQTAVVFAHVLWDASLFYGEDLFDNYAAWLVQTISAASANPRLNWVVKAHPSNVFRSRHGHVSGESSELTLIRERLTEVPDHIRVLPPETRISTRSIYEFADVGITVRGTPGLEMACFGKTVLTAGTGSYSGLGFTIDSSTTHEYLERLAAIETLEPPSPDATDRARRYAHTLFSRRPWRPVSFENRFEFPDRGWHPLDRNVRLRAHSHEALDAAGDLDEWAAWVLDTTDLDYLPHGSASLMRTPAPVP
jgi:hypothetical protein